MPPPHIDLPDELENAIQNGRLTLAFQPEYDLTDSRILAVEALARWHHPERGDISPDHFVRTAVRYDLIEQLSSWVLGAALTELERWSIELGSAVPILRINLAIAQLIRPGFIDDLSRALTDHHCGAHQICVEITESAQLTDPAGAGAAVRALRALGVSVAVDDLASGYSTLGSLRWLPVDVVKIDRSLVTNVDTDVRAVIILSSLVTIARELNVELVAEGVETAREAAVLASLGCTRAQGNYFARPMPGTDLLQLLLRNRPAPHGGSATTRAARPAPGRRHAVRPRPQPR